MDEPIPEETLPKPMTRVYIRVSKGTKNIRGKVIRRPTLTLEELANRIADKGSKYSQDTLLDVFRIMTDEVYQGIADGFNVDFGLGKTELSIGGEFATVDATVDKKRNFIKGHLLSSPRLKQYSSNLPMKNVTQNMEEIKPELIEISLNVNPTPSETLATANLNVLPAGKQLHVSIFGKHLKVSGKLPGCGITIRNLDKKKEYFISKDDLVVNTDTRLCIMPEFVFTPGKWEAVVSAQFILPHKAFRKLRSFTLPFVVEENNKKRRIPNEGIQKV